jgi:hypothetical protein
MRIWKGAQAKPYMTRALCAHRLMPIVDAYQTSLHWYQVTKAHLKRQRMV